MECSSGMGRRATAVLLFMGEDKINAAEVESLVLSRAVGCQLTANC